MVIPPTTIEGCDDGNTADNDARRNDRTLHDVATASFKRVSKNATVMAIPPTTMRHHLYRHPMPQRLHPCTMWRRRIVQAGVEECDDGNTADNDACRNECMPAALHDVATASSRLVSKNATMAIPPTTMPAAMATERVSKNATMHRRKMPGDGKIIHAGVEECDDGNTADNDACRNDCTLHDVATASFKRVSKNATTVMPMTPTHA